MLVGLLAVSGAYGFHGDEMYFVVAGQHPAFGYVDQPPLTPLLSAASVAVLGVSPTAVRVLPAVEMALIVILIALIARDLGGSRRAQVLAAITAALSGYLGAGHLDTTTEPDLLAWAIVLWLLVKLLAGGDRRLWLAVGVVTGIGLENKDTLLFLGAGLAAGLVLTRRWDVVRSPWAWSAIGIALLLWLPNLAWQAANGWPQLTMAAQISGYAGDNRAQVVPLLWLFTGPLLFPVSAAGLAWVLVAKAAAPWRAIGIAGIVALVLVFLAGGKAYYAIGTASLCMAAGGIVLDRWLARGHLRLKAAGFAAAAVLSSSLIVLLTLPILPVATYATTSLPATVPDTANQVGWPQFVATVEGVVAALPARRARPRGHPDQRLQRGEPARAARLRPAPGLLGPQLVLELGPAAGRPHGRGPCGRLEARGLEPVLRGLSRGRPHRQRTRDRQRRAGQGRLRVHRPARAVDRPCGRASGRSPRRPPRRASLLNSYALIVPPGCGGASGPTTDADARPTRRPRSDLASPATPTISIPAPTVSTAFRGPVDAT